MTRYKPWGKSEELAGRKRDEKIDWLLKEIKTNSSADRPGFMSVMVTSWTFFPSWVKELSERLPDDYVVVSIPQMAELYRRWMKER